MIILDASVVIALLDANDAHHARAVELFHDRAPDGFSMHSLTMAEVLVGAAHAGRANARFAQLASVGIVVAEQRADEPVALAELRASSGLRMPDCCVLVAALQSASSLATFDDRLSRAATKAGLAVVS